MKSTKMWHAIRSTGLVLAVLLFVLGAGAGCSGKKSSNHDLGDYSAYLGDYSYNAPLTAMVYEDLDGEGEGILYREVTDYDKLIAYAPVPVCLYFHSSYSADTGGVTAAVEQLAEDYHGKILFVTVDADEETDLASHFKIEAVPDFILLENGSLKASFSSFGGMEWTESDLQDWILDNIGIS